jgi:high-affinity Fe2+/Pb2+ permease
MDGKEFITSIVALGGVPLILGLVQLFKPFITDTRFYPLLAVGFGLAINLVAGWALGAGEASEWVTALLNGIIAGMAAAGLYSAGSTLKEGAAADKGNRKDEGENHETI